MDLGATLRADLAPAGTDYATRWTMRIWRTGQWLRLHDRTWWRPLALRACRVLHVVWVELLIGAVIPTTVSCGPGLRLMHGGRGVVFHFKTRIGSNCTIYHGVTIGARSGNTPPVIGDNVYIGNGASVLGAITVGDGARIGAGAVVVSDVPAGATMVGVPAHAI